jgi:enoyl-[acyl-carrier protein] reductase III
VGDPEHIKKIFNTVREKFGKLDIFISNAATGVLKPIMDIDLKDWQRTMDINARALLFCAQEAAKLMDGGGRIISLSSMGSHRWVPKYAAVGTSKAAIESLTRYLAVELAPKRIIVNAVCSGVVDTDSLKFFPDRDKILEKTTTYTPMGRIGEPEDIAKVVVMLCSEEASWICGQTIIADGGYAILS